MVTREDVAKKAGVSVSAVSRTMNKSGYVAKEKQEAIYQAVKELGYRPNPIIATMKQNKTNQICFFGKDLTNPFIIELYNSMVARAKELEYTVFLNSTMDINKIKTMLIDGLILPNDSVAFELQELIGTQFYIPMISASYGLNIIRTKNIPFVDVDTNHAVDLLFDYLRKRGHKKIALATPVFDKEHIINHPRHVAYCNHMKPVFGNKIADYIFDCKEIAVSKRSFAEEKFFDVGLVCAEKYVAAQCDATAIMCFNDDFALGMMKRLQELGVRIPEDVSIVGCDGIGARKYVSPLLTTVSLHSKEQGAACVDVLIDRIEGRHTKPILSILATIVEGNSVKIIR